MKRVLITGAAGFVGANLAQRLVCDGHRVHLTASRNSSGWRLAELEGRATVHRLDLREADTVRRMVETIRPDWVFHLAAHGAYSWQTDTPAIFQTNLMGTIHLVDACRAVGIEALVNTGSSSEYGWKDHAPAEDEWIEPNSSYAIAKAAATHYCRHVALTTSFRACTLRLYSVYGPFEEPARLMPALLMHAGEGRYPPLVRPDIARDYVYIDDVIDACLLAIAAPQLTPGAVYNVGTGIQTSLREVVEVVRELFQMQEPPKWGSMPDRCWDTDTWVADSRRLQEQLGWRPATSLSAGLSAMRGWLEQPQWCKYYADRVKIRQAA